MYYVDIDKVNILYQPQGHRVKVKVNDNDNDNDNENNLFNSIQILL